jgi:beta-N-acetylhexosaminidase
MRSRLLCLLLVFVVASPSSGKQRYLKSGPIHLDRGGEKWAEKTLRNLSLEEKIGQLFMIWVRAQFLNVENPDYLQLRDTMQKYHVGSFAMTVRWDPPFLYRNQPYEAVYLLNRLQQDSSLPLLFAADFERGVSMRLHGTTEFPHAMAFGATGDPRYAEDFGRITAQEARAIGVHWNFFPDADVNSNPANPIINTRSFGEDPKQVSEFVTAYIKGAHDGGMLTTAKHFPGHGDTATDSHLGVAQVTGDINRLQSVELAPFRAAIAAGVDSVMVAHLSVPALESNPDRVATTSPAVVTDLLRKHLGFNGIVVTDALDMAGLTRLYAPNLGRAAVDAFKAGNDLLIIPADLDASFNAMLQAARSGEIPQHQIDASVLKILKTKASLGLHRARLVDPAELSKIVGAPANLQRGQEISDDAITLVRDNGHLLPLKHPGTVAAGLPYTTVKEVHDRLVVVVLSEDVRTEAGRVLEHGIKEEAPDARVIYVDPQIAQAMSEDILKDVDQAEAVVAAVYVIPTPGRMRDAAESPGGSVALADASGALLKKILDHAAAKTIVLAMGNPYLAADYPEVQNYLCAFSNSAVSERSAAQALFGEIAIRGHLPVSIPGIASRGMGIALNAHSVTGGSQHGISSSSN